MGIGKTLNIEKLKIEACASCGNQPEYDGSYSVRCKTANCFLRGMLGWSPIGPWNELMIEVAAKKFQKEGMAN